MATLAGLPVDEVSVTDALVVLDGVDPSSPSNASPQPLKLAASSDGQYLFVASPESK